MSAWRNIETDPPPQDGTEFIIRAGDAVYTAFYMLNKAPNAKQKYVLRFLFRPDRYAAVFGAYTPTYWMLMPPLPDREQQDG